jgi:tRNA dimethylallyltransferase
VAETDSKLPLLVLVGPTAVGKTKMSLSIAHQFNCEIISGDSMQIYRYMDIGTAKLPERQREGIPHHMIDIVDPDEPFSAADFQQMANTLIADIHRRGRLPFVVGGTGLYVEALCYGFEFTPSAGGDAAFREEMKEYAARNGAQALHDRLREVDPQTAERLHPNDQRRIIRALEIFRISGRPMSDWLARQAKVSPYRLCLIGLSMERELLYRRIEQRVDEMIREGLVDEVQRLLDLGYSADLTSMQGLGYKEIVGYLRGEYSLEEAVQLLKRNTRRFAKRQLSWFRHMKEIQWVDVTETENFFAHLQEINAIIAGKFPFLLE